MIKKSKKKIIKEIILRKKEKFKIRYKKNKDIKKYYNYRKFIKFFYNKDIFEYENIINKSQGLKNIKKYNQKILNKKLNRNLYFFNVYFSKNNEFIKNKYKLFQNKIFNKINKRLVFTRQKKEFKRK